MAIPPTLPPLPGLSWSIHKKPLFSTRIATHVSGREARLALYAHALYEFELAYDGLDSSGTRSNLQLNSLQTLLGFYMQAQGQLNTFLYVDPTDNLAINQQIGVGDSVTTQFVMQRTIGGFTEPASWVVHVSSVTVNGVATGFYTLIEPNIISFAVAPSSGAIIQITFSYAFQCRFLEDQIDFENIMNGIWGLKSLKFRTVR